MRRLHVLIFLTFLTVLETHASFSDIDSIKIFPALPTSHDTVRLIGYIWCPDSYALQSHIATTNDSNILVRSCYFLGNDAEAYLVQDTVILGLLPPGNYRLLYTLKEVEPPYDTDSINSCVTFPFTDSAFINFTVWNASGMNEIISDEDIKVYPNPYLSGQPNTFQYMNTGIYVINTPLNVYTNIFDSIRNYESVNTYGFYGSAVVGSPSLTMVGRYNWLTVQTAATTPDSTSTIYFNNCDYGVRTLNYGLNAYNNRMENVIYGVYSKNTNTVVNITDNYIHIRRERCVGTSGSDSLPHPRSNSHGKKKYPVSRAF